MKKALVIVAVVVFAVMVTLAMTKPDQTAHYNALKTVVLKAVEEKVEKSVPYEGLRMKATIMALNTADDYLKRNLFFYEKTFYNKGILVYEDYFILVSVGVMGHVYLTFDEKDVGKMVDRMDVMKMVENDDVRMLMKNLK